MFQAIKPTSREQLQPLAGDDIVPHAGVIMDRAFTLNAPPAEVWPWFVQLGKNRAGWYFPKSIERFITPQRRGLWQIDSNLQRQAIGKRIDDWGGKRGYLEVVKFTPPSALIYKSRRGKTTMSWAITLWTRDNHTRVLIRLRLSSNGGRLFYKLGDIFDGLTILGLAAGLRERLA